MLAWMAGCTDPADVETGPVELVDVFAFAPSTVDPVEHGAVDCPVAGWGIEGSSLEIDTGLCRYGVFEQPLLHDVHAIDTTEIVFWHNQLVADGAAEGHLLLAIGDRVVFEKFVPIPAEPDAYTVERFGIEGRAGEMVRLHLHNHGANTWNFLHWRILK